MRIAAAVTLNPEQRQALERMARARSMPARLVERAQIVLLAADGLENKQIAQRMNMTPKKAARWRNRFLAAGIAALEKDAPYATHWSTRTMARAAGISEASVRRIWRAHGLKPHQVRTFKLSRDPQFQEKLEDIVGLYESARARHRAVRRREEPDSGSGPYPARPADEEGPLRHHDP